MNRKGCRVLKYIFALLCGNLCDLCGKIKNEFQLRNSLSLINRDRFDYTKWRENLFKNMSVEEIIEKGREFAVDFRKIKGNVIVP